MFLLVVGGGKVGVSVTRTLLALNHEVALIEQERNRFERLEEEFEHRAVYGDGTELFVLERAGISRPPNMVLALIEHEVPQHELVHLLELRKENLEIVEVEIKPRSAAEGKRVEELRLPESTRLISVMREGKAEIAVGSTELRAGDQVLAILEPGRETELKKVLLDERARV